MPTEDEIEEAQEALNDIERIMARLVSLLLECRMQVTHDLKKKIDEALKP